MKAFGKLLSVLWTTTFWAFLVGVAFYVISGKEAPEEIVLYLNALQSWLESSLASWMFFAVIAVGWIAISYHLGKKSGWQKLAVDYAESGTEPGQKFSKVSGQVGSVHHQGSLLVGAHPPGLALRVLLPFRLGSANLRIPWTAIESITVSKKPAPPGKSNFLEIFLARFSNARYAHFRLVTHPEQILIVSWKEKIRAGVPSHVNLIVQES